MGGVNERVDITNAEIRKGYEEVATVVILSSLHD